MLKPLLTGRTIVEDHTEWLYFAGTSYLGIPHNQGFNELLNEGFKLFGAHFGGSRHSNIHLNVFTQAEQFLSDWLGCPEVLLTSSGTLAGQLVIQQLAEFRLIYAPNTHSALFIEPQPPLEGWPQTINSEISKYPDRPVAILTNTVDPLTLKPIHFDWLEELPNRSDLLVVIDDSHGLGLVGSEGSGFYQYVHSKCEIPVVVISSLGKALGIPAGLIGGPSYLVQQIFDHPLFIGSSTPSPAFLYALLNAKEIYQQLMSVLKSNVQFFTHHCEYLSHFRYFSEYPVFYSDEINLYDHLKSKGIICSSFSYPTKHDDPLTRLVFNACHTKEDITKLSECITGYF